MKTVAVLFARSDSVYKTLPECDVYDMERDARTYTGNSPCVCHPPCRLWGQLAHMATKARPDEKDLALFSVAKVRANGGVLEHPKASRLWPVANLPEPGLVDEFGGWTLQANQLWWGHKAVKPTRFYIVGCNQKDCPPIPLYFGEATHAIDGNGSNKKGLSHAAREHTPPELAKWLVELAKLCGRKQP